MIQDYEDQLTDKGKAVLAAYRKAVAEGKARPIPETTCPNCGAMYFGHYRLCEPCEGRYQSRNGL